MSALDGEGVTAERRASVLYRQYSSWLNARIRQEGYGDLADDIVQETFTRLISSASTELSHPRSFLLKIAQNLLSDTFRKGATLKRTAQDDGLFEHQAFGSTDQFETVLLKQVVLALPDIYRDVFLLSRFDGMSYDQIAAVRGISVKTVEWRMSRALAMCAARMRE